MALSSKHVLLTVFQQLCLCLLVLCVAVQGHKFPGFQIYHADPLGGLVTAACQNALVQPIHCHNYLKMYMSPQVGKSTGNSKFTDVLCDSSCGASLQSWVNNVASNCANETLDHADHTLLGGYIWQGYNETCLKDPLTGKYCTDVVTEFTTVSSMEAMPTDELCSWCWTQMIMMMQNSSYSVFNDYYQSGMKYMVSECHLNASTTMPESLIYPRPTLTPMCLSDQYYTIQEGDTCDTIALAHNVTSASIATGNPMIGNRCSSPSVGTTICMPLSCTPLHTLQPDDSCYTLDRENDLVLDGIQQYNPWINYPCTNLFEVIDNLGSVICLGPQGGRHVSSSTFEPNAADTSKWRTGYSLRGSAPPANATVANGTTPYCGTWYTVKEGDTCAKICSMEYIPSSLFLACNPSLNSTNCDSSLVVNMTYCVSPHSSWEQSESW